MQPHEMPWARAAQRAPSLAPQKSLAKPPVSALDSLDSDSSGGFESALRAEEEARAKEEAEKATAAAQQTEAKTAVHDPLLFC